MSHADLSMVELFRIEVENQAAEIIKGLLELERDAHSPKQLQSLMRSSHSIKGAARIVNLPNAVVLAHAMEDCFSAAQKGLKLKRPHFDLLLKGADHLARIALLDENKIAAWIADNTQTYSELAGSIRSSMTVQEDEPPASGHPPGKDAPPHEPHLPTAEVEVVEEKALRINAELLDRLIGLAAEFLVESRRLAPFVHTLLRIVRRQNELTGRLEGMERRLRESGTGEHDLELLRVARQVSADNAAGIATQWRLLEGFERRSNQLSRQLYREATTSRMRPFAEGVASFPRMVRDVASELGKSARLDIVGQNTLVDRDILEMLQAPLNHLLRNAIDHGIESPDERMTADKPAEGVIRLEARHQAGMLFVAVEDDGRGIDPDVLRRAVVKRSLASEEVASGLSITELYDFLFLPGFTLKDKVTEISGRGVGLDVVMDTLQQIRGSVRTHSEIGRGTHFQLQLPLTLSVMRGLVTQIAGEAYVFPLARVERALILEAHEISSLQGHDFFYFNGKPVGIVAATQVLELPDTEELGDRYNVVVISDRDGRFGITVDCFVGESNLVVRPLDPGLGKLRDIAAETLLEDGTPALILDVEDLTRSIDRLIGRNRLRHGKLGHAAASVKLGKRILVVDDSFTVREVERKLLENKGYRVEVAVDGMDGWNASRAGGFDLVITDVDMPRMNGIELVAKIKKDVALKSMPVVIMSYKDREEDRLRGLDAGADYYLTKGNFNDEALLEVVTSLIGEA